MAKPPKKLKFEEAMSRLEEIVSAMESGEIGIEESIARYEEAMGLAAHCRMILDQAELRVREIRLAADAEFKSRVLDSAGAQTAPEEPHEPSA